MTTNHMRTIEIDHAAYAAKVKTKSVAELRYIIADARAAIDANPNGPKAGYYGDEIHYAAMELRDRDQREFAVASLKELRALWNINHSPCITLASDDPARAARHLELIEAELDARQVTSTK